MRDLARSVEYPSLTANSSARRVSAEQLLSTREYIPAWNSNVLLRMFIRSFTTVSIGERASENRMNPMMMGNSLWKPKDWYRERLLMKTENKAKM